MAFDAWETPVPGRALCVLVPWFVLPVLASPLVVLLGALGAGETFGLDRAGFREVCLTLLIGYFQIWAVVTLAAAAAGALVARRRGASLQIRPLSSSSDGSCAAAPRYRRR